MSFFSNELRKQFYTVFFITFSSAFLLENCQTVYFSKCFWNFFWCFFEIHRHFLWGMRQAPWPSPLAIPFEFFRHSSGVVFSNSYGNSFRYFLDNCLVSLVIFWLYQKFPLAEFLRQFFWKLFHKILWFRIFYRTPSTPLEFNRNVLWDTFFVIPFKNFIQYLLLTKFHCFANYLKNDLRICFEYSYSMPLGIFCRICFGNIACHSICILWFAS